MRASRLLAGLGLLLAVGCDPAETKRDASGSAPPPAPARAVAAAPMPPSPAPVAAVSAPKTEPAACPAGMAAIPGGSFWVGRATPTFEEEENPRFKTKLPSFCAHTHEVTASAYEACVAEGRCTPIALSNYTCNSVQKGRGDHPANCVDHAQAAAFCAAEGARLPTELEWEYLARGGAEMRSYPWGEAGPDDHACWKANQSCKVGSYPAGAFGLYDVVGNVWEWTDSWFGPYPWPNPDGRHRVYRGGSWSRRFDKWMQPTLRNRSLPKDAGSHLGFRCAADQPGAECPYGRGAAGCNFGVDEALCLGKKSWNGARCTAPGDTARCAEGSSEVPGQGCVWHTKAPEVSTELDLSLVKRSPSPKYDADCQANQPTRPHAYRLDGGEHLARNHVARDAGCKNRDVGVGWNSVCCP